jgi:hypothetical protein
MFTAHARFHFVRNVSHFVEKKRPWKPVEYFVVFTLGEIQYGGFVRARLRKSVDMIRDQVRILYLLFRSTQFTISNR